MWLDNEARVLYLACAGALSRSQRKTAEHDVETGRLCIICNWYALITSQIPVLLTDFRRDDSVYHDL